MKNKKSENYLEKIPQREPSVGWTQDESGLVTLELLNRGVFNKLAQLILRKPKISYIHLDENGSFVWLQLDGKQNILEIGKAVKAHFGSAAEPLYERLTQFIRLLEEYKFVKYE